MFGLSAVGAGSRTKAATASVRKRVFMALLEFAIATAFPHPVSIETDRFRTVADRHIVTEQGGQDNGRIRFDSKGWFL